jgi:hypothetical protein
MSGEDLHGDPMEDGIHALIDRMLYLREGQHPDVEVDSLLEKIQERIAFVIEAQQRGKQLFVDVDGGLISENGMRLFLEEHAKGEATRIPGSAVKEFSSDLLGVTDKPLYIQFYGSGLRISSESLLKDKK